MDGLTGFIAAVSMDMSQYNVQSQASLALLKNTMNSQEAASERIIEDLSKMAPPADGHGSLMDVRA